MSSRINQHTYKKLIDENLEWLATTSRSLERDHIELIVKASESHEYDSVKVTTEERFVLLDLLKLDLESIGIEKQDVKVLKNFAEKLRRL